MLWRIVSAVLALIFAGAVYLVLKLYKLRAELDGLPMPPMEGGKFWGHLKIAGDCKRLFPPNVHVQNWANFIRKKYQLGDVFYVDWWPLGPRWCFVADPVLASQYCTASQSLPKSRLVTGFLTDLLGPGNMVTAEGHAWKSLRTIFNPGFSASHLTTLVPYIVDASMVFLKVLREKATTKEMVELDPLSIGFAIDIIGKVVMDSDFNSQNAPHPIVTHFRRQVALLPNGTNIGPFDRFDPIGPIRLWLNARKLNAALGAEIDFKVAARRNEYSTSSAEKGGKKRRSIVDLALDAYEKEAAETAKSGGRMKTSFRDMCIDSIKTFIFAGHDTTSSTISYTMYLLHLHPQVHKSLVKELSSVYGAETTPEEMATLIKDDPRSVNKLEYLTCVLKEVLRLFPPASTLRELSRPADVTAAKHKFMTDPKTGKQYPMVGFDMWPMAHLIHRNEYYFPQPIEFIPERFLSPSHPNARFPEAGLHQTEGKDAWQPFSKGPRNCIGQELAMMEAKVVIALIVRDIDFTAEYEGKKIEVGDWTPIETADEYKDGKAGKERLTIEGHKSYQVLFGAARPAGGMPGRLSLRR